MSPGREWGPAHPSLTLTVVNPGSAQHPEPACGANQCLLFHGEADRSHLQALGPAALFPDALHKSLCGTRGFSKNEGEGPQHHGQQSRGRHGLAATSEPSEA